MIRHPAAVRDGARAPFLDGGRERDRALTLHGPGMPARLRACPDTEDLDRAVPTRRLDLHVVASPSAHQRLSDR